ncbi:Transposable element Tcb2 transposase [Chionoecetes opilio]|uniref:Transposable element Tcb2 transposase n=1 Tax=Chionoecetes opilio TaxID=41210 RepID=A0A8J5CKU1_CHIOP|nr:Transposable element Tcb2 transposase [Chionoecetes opilio]
MVWGCFSGRGLGKLVVLPKNLKVNQAVYLEVLCEHLPDSFDLTRPSVFQQDGAPAHTAKSVTKWLDYCMVPFIKDWPGNSPDLNPIENLWHMVKKDLQGKDVSSIPIFEKDILISCGRASPDQTGHSGEVRKRESNQAYDTEPLTPYCHSKPLTHHHKHYPHTATPSSQVCLDMFGNMTLGKETLAANITLAFPFTSVGEHVLRWLLRVNVFPHS